MWVPKVSFWGFCSGASLTVRITVKNGTGVQFQMPLSWWIQHLILLQFNLQHPLKLQHFYALKRKILESESFLPSMTIHHLALQHRLLLFVLLPQMFILTTPIIFITNLMNE